MKKVWVLDTETRGTGAEMVPLEKVRKDAARGTGPAPGSRRRLGRPAKAPEPAPRGETTSTPLPPGHVRKKSTGEIGRVQSVNARGGTATVLWLRQGRSSTVPLTAISR